MILARNALDDTFEGPTVLTGEEAEAVKPLKEEIELARPQPDSLDQWVDTAIGSNPALAALQKTVDAPTIRPRRPGRIICPRWV